MITVGENTRVAPEEARNYHVSVSIAVANLDNRRRPGHSTVAMSGGSDGHYSATLLFKRGWRLVHPSSLETALLYNIFAYFPKKRAFLWLFAMTSVVSHSSLVTRLYPPSKGCNLLPVPRLSRSVSLVGLFSPLDVAPHVPFMVFAIVVIS